MQEFHISRAYAQINLKNAEHNYNLIKKTVSPNTKIMPIIKANAYGHGAAVLSELYKKLGAAMFAVAGIDEAVELVNSWGNTSARIPILILGATLPILAPVLSEYDIVQTVFSLDYAMELKKYLPCDKKLKIHIKINSGMMRIGFCEKHINDIEKVCKMPCFEVCGIFTHFAESDNLSTDFTDYQLKCYNDILKKLKDRGITFPIRHTANSAAVLCRPETHFDIVRPGIILYGSYPSNDIKSKYELLFEPLLPVMTFKSRIAQISNVKKGESIGYSRTFFAPCDMTIATVCAGYADGVPRLLSNKGRVSVSGSFCNIVGTVCMDQFMIDITGKNQIKPFDEVTIFGEGGPSCEEVANICNTISYEIYCSIAKRVERKYNYDGSVNVF